MRDGERGERERGRLGDKDDEFNKCLEKYWILFHVFLRVLVN